MEEKDKTLSRMFKCGDLFVIAAWGVPWGCGLMLAYCCNSLGKPSPSQGGILGQVGLGVTWLGRFCGNRWGVNFAAKDLIQDLCSL